MLEADVHEPEKFLLIASPVVPCKMEVLNEYQWADYRWQDYEENWVQVERKTWGEVLASMDAVEDQLRRHLKNRPEARLLFLIEGMVMEDGDGTHILTPTKDGKVFVRGYRHTATLNRVYSWLFNVSRYLEVFQVPNYNATVQFLVQAYKQSKKPPEDHKTFNRYFKKVTFHPNPQVLALIGIMPGIGEVKAEALIDRFTTVYGVLSASPGELAQVDGIGPKLSRTLLQRMGRVDV